MEHNNIYEKLKEILNELGGEFSILEEQVDVNLQVEFFELINEIGENKKDSNEVFAEKEKLFDPNIPIDEKKNLLAELSKINKPESYRLIEKVIDSGQKDIYSWAVLALQHCRIGLENSLLDESQVFISTGLGGKGEKLRYFIACKLKTNQEFSETQKKIVQSEFDDVFKINQSKIEKITFIKNHVSIIALIPIDVSIGNVIKSAIQESNQYGDFLFTQYLITNVKMLDHTEIKRFFKEKGI